MADFTWTPQLVKPTPARFNVLSTPSENLKRRYYEVDSTPERLYELEFGWIQKTNPVGPNDRDSLHDHYEAHKGPYTSFDWTGVPSYISGENITVRYESYEETPDLQGNIWNVKIVLREEI